METTSRHKVGSKGGYDFYHVSVSKDIIGIAILGEDAKKAYAKAKTDKDKFAIVTANIVASIHYPVTGYWKSWMVAAFDNLPTARHHVVVTIKDTATAWGIDCSVLNGENWWRQLEWKNTRWTFKGGKGVFPLSIRSIKESDEILDHVNRLTSYVGPSAKILAKVDNRNGNILIKLQASLSLKDK